MAAEKGREGLARGFRYPAYLITRTVHDVEIPDFRTVALTPEGSRQRAEEHEWALPGLAQNNPRLHLWQIQIELIGVTEDERV